MHGIELSAKRCMISIIKEHIRTCGHRERNTELGHLGYHLLFSRYYLCPSVMVIIVVVVTKHFFINITSTWVELCKESILFVKNFII